MPVSNDPDIPISSGPDIPISSGPGTPISSGPGTPETGGCTRKGKIVYTVAISSLLLLCTVTVHAQNLHVSSHYDMARQTPIIGANYHYSPMENIDLTGFAEMWYNPENYAFPEDSWPFFSKHWVSYALNSRLSLSVELEISRNLPGAWSRSPVIGTFTFEPDRWHVHPKIGASLRVF